MRDLTEIRQQIDQIDQKMLALFKERMGCSVEVAEYKRGTGKAIYDPVRERQKIDALTKDEDELIIKKSVEEMFLQMMSISRRYQYSLLSQEDAYIDQTFEEVEALDIFGGIQVIITIFPFDNRGIGQAIIYNRILIVFDGPLRHKQTAYGDKGSD